MCQFKCLTEYSLLLPKGFITATTYRLTNGQYTLLHIPNNQKFISKKDISPKKVSFWAHYYIIKVPKIN